MNLAFSQSVTASVATPEGSASAYLPPLSLAPIPDRLPTPKYGIGQQVVWCHTSSKDFGRVVGLVYAAEASVSATGFHYAVLLDPASPSSALGVRADWGFEADLAPLATPPNASSSAPPDPTIAPVGI